MAKKEHKENEALDKEQQELQQDENLNQEAPATDAEEQEEHEETDEEKIARLEAELDKEKKEYVCDENNWCDHDPAIDWNPTEEKKN